ncbi:hypothetical protein AC579_7382 [Pseudocercospora musae]|uniref:Uncharacterized protein n=1 Tax=Pseudocercospora musae TaxID=113226 RepID=A0A139ICZ9_9PEZI|nr:hypothetical protein AC579_7382 [Pseudocercospora musae]
MSALPVVRASRGGRKAVNGCCALEKREQQKEHSTNQQREYKTVKQMLMLWGRAELPFRCKVGGVGRSLVWRKRVRVFSQYKSRGESAAHGP